MKLYEITKQYNEALEILQENDDLDAQTIRDTLEGLEGELHAKIEAVAAMALNIEARAVAIKHAEKRMAERRKSQENKAEAIKRYLKETMEALNLSRVDGIQFDLAIKKNPPSLVIESEDLLPGNTGMFPCRKKSWIKQRSKKRSNLVLMYQERSYHGPHDWRLNNAELSENSDRRPPRPGRRDEIHEVKLGHGYI